MAAILRSVRWRPGVLMAGLPLLLIAAGATGAPGDLDPTFGLGGRVFVNIDENPEAAASLVQQGDGKLLLGRATNFEGATSVDLSVVRLNPDGTLDAEYGDSGMASIDLPGITASTQIVVQQEAGKAVVVGPAWKDDNPDRSFFAVARYLVDGALDATFGSGGYVLGDFGAVNGMASVNAFLAQPDSRLVVAGSLEMSWGTSDTAFVRFNADGSVDKTFGINGYLNLDVEGTELADMAYALVRRPAGGLVAAVIASDAANHEHPVLLALTETGNVDTSFGTKGRATPAIAGEMKWHRPQIGLQSNGKIVLAGVVTHDSDASCELFVTRIDEAGQLDTTFGKSGFVTLPFSSCYIPVNVSVTTDDQVLISRASSYYSPWDYGERSPSDLLVVRLTEGGTLDATFGIAGTARIDLGVSDSISNINALPFVISLVQQTDGRLVLAATGSFDHEGTETCGWSGEQCPHAGIVVVRLLKSGTSPGFIGFRETLSGANESQASVVLPVRRTGGSAGAVSVAYETRDMGARSGSDYVRISGVLTWADGDTEDKEITIVITNDAEPEGYEALEVTLFGQTGGAILATSRSEVDIESNDGFPQSGPGSPPSTISTASSGSPVTPAGGGGAVNLMQLFSLALVLAATMRRGRSDPGVMTPDIPAKPIPTGRALSRISIQDVRFPNDVRPAAPATGPFAQ